MDPTGAGDCFAGGFMGYVAKRGNIEWSTLRQAVVAGSTIASFSVENFSVERFVGLEMAEVQARAERFKRLTEFPTLDLG